MKKKLLSYVFAGLLLTGASGCSDWLEILPENEMTLDDYWKTEADAQGVLSACYRGLIENDVTYRMIIWGEMRSDNMNQAMSIDENINRILRQEVTPTNVNCKWDAFYRIINYCNTFLRYAPDVIKEDPNFTEAELHSMESEVLTIRALAYFYLVRAFKDVPYVTEPSINDQQQYRLPQSPESVVIDTLIYDLNRALVNAPKSHYSVQYTKGRVTKNTIYALLADIYLWDEQYEKCMQACNHILADKSLSLVDADNVLKKVFYEGNSTESIFELQFDDEVQINYATRNLYGYAGNMIGNICFPAILAPGQLYSPFKYSLGGGTYEGEKDIRFKDYLVPFTSLGYYSVFKYAGLSRSENSLGSSTYTFRTNTSNWIMYRLSDIILMKAEAMLQNLNQQGKTESSDLDDVLSLVNVTYHRSNPDADTLRISSYNGFMDIQSLVLRERQRELMFEGKRWFDLMRLARRNNSPSLLKSYVAKTTTGNEALGKISTMNALYWPINKDELEANRLLKQNPFYETVVSSN